MNCNEFNTQLDYCIEEKLTPSTEVESHGTTCQNQTCSDRWDEHQQLERWINAWLRSVPTVDLTDSVHARLASEFDRVDIDVVEVLGPARMVRGKTSSTRAAGAIAAAVSLLVTAAILIAISIRSTTPDLANNLPVTTSPDSIAKQNNAVEEQKLRQLGQTYASLMTDAKTRVTNTVAMVIPPEDSMLTEGMGSTSKWLDTWSERLEPLETKLDQTLRNFVNDTITEMNDQAS